MGVWGLEKQRCWKLQAFQCSVQATDQTKGNWSCVRSVCILTSIQCIQWYLQPKAANTPYLLLFHQALPLGKGMWQLPGHCPPYPQISYTLSHWGHQRSSKTGRITIPLWQWPKGKLWGHTYGVAVRILSCLQDSHPLVGIPCVFLILRVDKTREHDETSLLWSGYVTWQTCKDFADVIKVPNQLTLSQLYYPRCCVQGCGLPWKEGSKRESSPAGLEDASCQELGISEKMNVANNHVSLGASWAQITPQLQPHETWAEDPPKLVPRLLTHGNW